jgi:paraquat-inducible protein A
MRVMRVDNLIACHECDLLHQKINTSATATARCVRCGAVLFRFRRNSLDRTLALSLAGLILFAIANMFPFLAFKFGTQVHQTVLLTGIKELYLQGWPGLAALVLLTTFLAPLVILLGLVYILLPLKFDYLPPRAMPVFRWVRCLQPWSMLEIFMLGLLISMIKLIKMAELVPGVALMALMALIFVMAATAVVLDPHLVWDKWELSL